MTKTRPRSSRHRTRVSARAVLRGVTAVRLLASFSAATALLTVTAAITRGSTAALLCATALGTFVLMLITVVNRKNYDFMEPFSFVIFAATVGTAFKAIYVAFVDSEHVTSRVLLNQPPEVLLTGCLFVLLGLGALCFGYSVRLPRLDLSRFPLVRRYHWDRRVLSPVMVAALVVSIGSFLMWFNRMGIDTETLVDMSQKRVLAVEGSEFDTSLAYLTWGVSVAEVTFYVLLTWRLIGTQRMPWFATACLPVMGVIALVFPAISSSRGGMMTVVLTTLILMHYLRSGLRYRAVAVVLPVALAGFLAVTAARNARNPDVAATRFTVERLLETTIGGRHFMDVAKTSYIIEAVPERIPRAHGGTLWKWAVAPIPRTVWPEKPVLDSAPLISATIYGMPTSGVPPGFIAELYMNFGTVGVPVGMFLLGVLLRSVYAHFAPFRQNPNAILLYAVCVVPLSFFVLQADLTRGVVKLLRAAVPLALLLLVIGRRHPFLRKWPGRLRYAAPGQLGPNPQARLSQ